MDFNVAFNTVLVISEETSTYSCSRFCTVNCRPSVSNYQLSHIGFGVWTAECRGWRRLYYHCTTMASKSNTLTMLTLMVSSYQVLHSMNWFLPLSLSSPHQANGSKWDVHNDLSSYDLCYWRGCKTNPVVTAFPFNSSLNQ